MLDTRFDFSTLNDITKKEIELKNIPGVMGVGLFTRRAMFTIKQIQMVLLKLLGCYDIGAFTNR